MPNSHFEPYLYVPEVFDTSVTIAWGGFFFWTSGPHPTDGDDFRLVDDQALKMINPPRKASIGASSEAYDRTGKGALVEVFENRLLAKAVRSRPDRNHAVVTGLRPDTEYTYRVTTNDNIDWASGQLRDWTEENGFKGLKHSRSYDRRFRTNPDRNLPAGPVTFAVLGDYGRGINAKLTAESRQREVAKALGVAIDEFDVRFVLTTGDNIYQHETGSQNANSSGDDDTGNEDDDWFFSYFQPYRYLLNRIPVYPSSGNHDTGESDKSDDFTQLLDNFYLKERFTGPDARGPASFEPGVFYRFRYGSTIEFVCLDTTKKSALSGKRFFEHENHQPFLTSTFAKDGVRWRIPFCHHPPFSAGPTHLNTTAMHDKLVALCETAGVKAFFSGHEHNFQCSKHNDTHYFVTGGGGDLRLGTPKEFKQALTHSWGKGGHFLIVTIDGDSMTVRVIGELGPGGKLTELPVKAPDGSNIAAKFVVQL
jgi:tartrate-resistant acid phosphatase type 5